MFPVPWITMASEMVVAQMELGVAQVCAVITRGVLTHDATLHLQTLNNTAIGNNLYNNQYSYRGAEGGSQKHII